MMGEKVKITIGEKSFEYPVIEGTEREKAVDIANFRKDTQYIMMDNGFGNTGACASAITYLDGEKGILRYRGIPIEQLAESSTFVETSYLLINGKLPSQNELKAFAQSFTKHAALHKDMVKLLAAYPSEGHPMGLLSSMVCSLSGYYPDLLNPGPSTEEIDVLAAQLLAKVRTIAAYTYRHRKDSVFLEPRKDFRYIQNFLHMMFSTKKKDYAMEPEVVDALQCLLILHADHEQNCSTSTVRLIGSSWANLFASISGGISALWGPLHGGANQAVIEMLQTIHKDGGNIQKYIKKAKDPDGKYRLMGFGHRVYKNFDPRATIIKRKCHELFKKMSLHDPLLDLAVKIEKIVLEDEYFVQRKLYPNVDFYSGLIYKAIGIPTDMFPVMFAIGRMPGWIAHWKEMRQDKESKIGRPRQIYTGPVKNDYVPMEKR
jgi:citrate synthase